MNTEIIIKQLLDRELYVPENFIDEVSKYLTLREILSTIESCAGQSIISIRQFVIQSGKNVPEAIVYDMSQIPKIEGRQRDMYPSCKIHIVYAPKEKVYLNAVLNEVSVPTVYLTSRGKVTINFDVERLDYILYHSVIPQDFREYIWKLFQVYNELCMLHHLVGFKVSGSAKAS